jgi:hypothetical protein
MDLIIAGMTHQGWDVQLTAYAARDWRANFFPVGIAHSVVGGSAWEPTPSRAVSRVTFHRDAALDLSSAERRAAPRARNRQRFCATSPRRVQMAEGRTPGRLSSYELGVSAPLVDRTTDALSSSAPSRPGQIQALHRWVDWPSRVWAPRGSGSQCPSDGHYRGWMWQSRDRLRARHRPSARRRDPPHCRRRRDPPHCRRHDRRPSFLHQHLRRRRLRRLRLHRHHLRLSPGPELRPTTKPTRRTALCEES